MWPEAEEIEITITLYKVCGCVCDFVCMYLCIYAFENFCNMYIYVCIGMLSNNSVNFSGTKRQKF